MGLVIHKFMGHGYDWRLVLPWWTVDYTTVRTEAPSSGKLDLHCVESASVSVLSEVSAARDLLSAVPLSGRLALQVVQRNLRKYMQLRNWMWLKLWQNIKPMLNVTRIEDEMRVSRRRSVDLSTQRLLICHIIYMPTLSRFVCNKVYIRRHSAYFSVMACICRKCS